MRPRYAEVAVDLPVDATFHYSIPLSLADQVEIGKRVWVPFRNRQRLGLVVGFVQKPEVNRVKPISNVVDAACVLRPELLGLTRWMAKVYQTGWGETILTALPGPLRRGRTTIVSREPWIQEEPVATTALELNEEQRRALAAIRRALIHRRHEVFLLFGVTASGKTEVYLQAIHQVLARGQSAIVLVPEISLTPQVIERFQARFGGRQVAVLHSGMLESHRLSQWHRIRSGQARVVIGTRSAIFAPVDSLGLIVVDEEHEPSYKQQDSPRYHAREVAIERGKLCHAPVVLGSATPAIETYYQAKKKQFRLLTLTQRVEEVPLPSVDIVDMRRELAQGRRGRIFSRQLEEAIAEVVTRGEQAILFLNRRGFATFIQCRKCGFVARCQSCQVSLNYHIATRLMICHWCRFSQAVPELCPKCRSEYVRFQGIGTQRVESELGRLFPHARIARMDTDVTQTRGIHAKLIKEFAEHRIDLLVGTQMIAKGLDFPRVTLVGVISADTALHLPDFRSAERTFNLLTQVAGRAGRGKDPGRVIIQTFTPHHYGIKAASRHDYATFYAQEIEIRKTLHLPPFCRLVAITVRSPKEAKALGVAEKLAQALREELSGKAEALGPAPTVIHRLRRQYRWQVILKSSRLESIKEKLAQLLRDVASRGCVVAVDVDPL